MPSPYSISTYFMGPFHSSGNKPIKSAAAEIKPIKGNVELVELELDPITTNDEQHHIGPPSENLLAIPAKTPSTQSGIPNSPNRTLDFFIWVGLIGTIVALGFVIGPIPAILMGIIAIGIHLGHEFGILQGI